MGTSVHPHKATIEIAQEQGRAKALARPEHGRRVSPIVAEARRVVAAAWRRLVQRHASNVSVGALLWVSEKTARAWGDERDPKTVDAADLVALAMSGRRALVLDMLDALRGTVDGVHQRARLPREQHVRALTAQLGAVIIAHRDHDTVALRRALAALARRAHDALEDDEEGDDALHQAR